MSLDKLRQRISGPKLRRGQNLRVIQSLAVTVSELREAIASNPDHPVAHALLDVVAGRGDEKRLFVHKADLLGLLDDCHVDIERHQVDGGTVIYKSVGDVRSAASPAEESLADESAEDQDDR